MPRGSAPGERRGGRQQGAANQRTREIADRATREGITPLEYMLAVLRDPKASKERRDWAAEKAAPYMHPRLQAIQHSGPDGGPIETKDVSDLEVGRRLAYLLEKAVREVPKQPPGA